MSILGYDSTWKCQNSVGTVHGSAIQKGLIAWCVQIQSESLR